MMTISEPSVSFAEADDRTEAMHRAIENWLGELAELVDQAAASEEFRAWLDVQSRFHGYSYRNALLIKQQCPGATKVAGYRTWKEEFDRHVEAGERAIWIWAPIIARRCPECGNSPSHHGATACEYAETRPEQWSKWLVGFKPVAVFDVCQTEGEPLPELDTAATGDREELAAALLEAADTFGLDVRVVEAERWSHGAAKGVCTRLSPMSTRPLVEVVARSNDADLATTIIHEYAHARLHFDVDEPAERSKREVEAEAVAYVVGRYFGLDPSNSAFYLAAWRGEERGLIQERLERVSHVSEELIEAVGRAENHVTRSV